MNSVQDGVYGNAIGRDTSLSDKYFGMQEQDFGLDASSNIASDSQSLGINAIDYLDDGSSDSSISDMFSGVSLGGIGSAVKGVAAVYDSYNKKQYQDKIFGMEEKRVARQVKKEDDAQAALNAAWN